MQDYSEKKMKIKLKELKSLIKEAVREEVSKTALNESLKEVPLSFAEKVDKNVLAKKTDPSEHPAFFTPELVNKIKSKIDGKAKKFFKRPDFGITSTQHSVKNQKLELHTKDRSIIVTPFYDILQVKFTDHKGNVESEFYSLPK